jgi:hypothetical protein
MILVLANSISPVMFNHLAMLFVGNAIIGLIEGIVIAKVFKAPMWPCVGLLVVANYASMWAGAALFGIGEAPSLIPDQLFAEPLNHVRWLVAACIAIALIISLLVEWPFCYMTMPPGRGRFRKSVLATMLAQVSSYTCLGPFYLQGTNTLNREVNVVQTL